MNLIRSLIKRFYQWKLPANMQHMALYYPEFRLKENREIIWHGKNVASLRPIEELKQLQKDSCYIIATGPSINSIDLNRIPGDALLWGVNGAIALAAKYKLKFDCYTVVDADFIRKRFAMVREIILSGAHCLFSPYNIRLVCERDVTLLSKGKIYMLPDLNERYNQPILNLEDFDQWAAQDNDLILPKHLTHQGDRVGFSKNIAQGIFSGGTVVYGAIQAAYYVGCKEVNILGMDLGSTSTQPRFYDEGKNVCHSSLDKYYETIIEPSFKVLADLCQHEDFKVYNLSPQSRLPDNIIPKVQNYLTYRQATG
ncbi:MAG: hypothetical protein KAT71_01165 [Gammaproteobacteria bacterium]|nr:hypothetical protein [Gammaproteobacteria bacterium]